MTKRWIRVLLWVCVMLTAAMIFSFSSQDGETSAAISKEITRVVMEFVVQIRGDIPEAELLEMTQKVHQIVRKAAHMTEFALLGFFTLLLAHSYRLKRQGLVAWGASTLYAVTDEIHQRFVSDRGPDFIDVCIDSAGVLIGIGIATFGIWLVHRRRCANKKEGV